MKHRLRNWLPTVVIALLTFLALSIAGIFGYSFWSSLYDSRLNWLSVMISISSLTIGIFFLHMTKVRAQRKKVSEFQRRSDQKPESGKFFSILRAILTVCWSLCFGFLLHYYFIDPSLKVSLPGVTQHSIDIVSEIVLLIIAWLAVFNLVKFILLEVRR